MARACPRSPVCAALGANSPSNLEQGSSSTHLVTASKIKVGHLTNIVTRREVVNI